MPDLSGKVALVTGAASGLGAATARELIADGASVLLTDVNVEGAEALADELGDKAAALEHDVTDEKAWKEAVGKASELFGELNLLVNNAGIAGVSPALEMTTEEFNHVVAVNQLGPFLGMRTAIPAIADAGGGAVVNVASIDGHVGTPGLAHYVSAKHAVIGLTKTFATEVASMGVRVNSVSPGIMVTPIFDATGIDLEPLLGELLSKIPLGRPSDPAEVARAVAFLLSDEAGYVTGSDLVIDGGLIGAVDLLGQQSGPG
jgi:3alpha(or 20beta)-hydroxysteroid dehydrogenase